MFYDTRKELGNAGLTEPVEFTRDDMQYMPSAFEHMQDTLVKIDIWPAVDVTRVILGHETKLSSFTATFSTDHYRIQFGISSLSEEEAYKAKEAEIDTYGDSLIDVGYSEPTIGISVNPVYYRKKINRRKSNKSDKLSGDITLTIDEKNQAKTDEKLSEYETKISEDQEKAIANLHKLSGVDLIMTFDVPAQNWSVWNPP